MPSLSLGLPAAAAVGAGGSLLGGALSGGGALLAAGQQQKGIQSGIQTQITEQEILAGLMQPYFGLGQQGVNSLNQNIGALTKPFNPTMADLAATPGYQFTLGQGEQATANAYSGQGQGAGVTKGATAMTPSGPGAKGAINYAENLASTTYQQQFQNYLGQNSQIYSMLSGEAQMGEQATAAYGGVSQNMAGAISGLQSAGGAAAGAGLQSGANALGQGISGAGSGLSNFALLNSLGGGSLFGGGGLSDSQLTSGINAVFGNPEGGA